MTDDFLKLEKEKQYRTLLMWAKAYYEDDRPLVTDDYYDSCVKSYEELYGEKFEYMGAAVNAFSKFTHPYPVLSLDKVTSEVALKEKLKNDFEDKYIIQPKIDGLTVVYYPDGSMVSRGDGKVGEVLPFANRMNNLPKPLDRPVRMEVYLPKTIFNDRYSEISKNPRNIAAGIIRRKEYTVQIKDLRYYAYNILGDDSLTESKQLEILQENGFTTVPVFDKKYSASEIKLSFLNIIDSPTDGLVYKYDGTNQKLKINTSHHPKNMIAFKYQSEIAKTVLRKIEWSMGRDRYTPVAVFDPVILGGNQISRASVHNLNIMRSLNLKKNADILVTLKNEIIPQIFWCSGEGDDIPIPDYCALCGSRVKKSESGILTCPNESCKGKIISDIKRLVSREGLDIREISDKTIKKIECKSVEEFLEMKEEDFRTKGLGEKTSKNIAENIEKAVANISPAKFLTAMNIPLIGKNQSEIIMNYFDNDINRFFNEIEKLTVIPGVGEISYASIFSKLPYLKIMAKKFTFKSVKENDVKNKYRIAITGTLSKARNEIISEIEEAGHTFSASVNASVNYLVASKDSIGSSKYKKAKKLGIKIISENDMRELL